MRASLPQAARGAACAPGGELCAARRARVRAGAVAAPSASAAGALCRASCALRARRAGIVVHAQLQRLEHLGTRLSPRLRARAATYAQSRSGVVRNAPAHASGRLLATRSCIRSFYPRQLVRASFFGVGAPEAFVIAIVSLLVFGPKGLAEVRRGARQRYTHNLTQSQTTAAPQIAKNLGQTLRAFQPTIRELQQVSQDFKSALDQEVRALEQRNPWLPFC
jgi:Sec-independent protein translocase protein TatA